MIRNILVIFSSLIPEKASSLIYYTSARHERHECDTSDTNARRVRLERYECDKSETRVRRECYTNDTSATRALHERHECDTSEKNLILITTRVKTYFHILSFTLWQVKDYKKWNNFILSTTFGNPSFPYQNAFEKCTTKTRLCNGKSYIKKLYSRL